MKVVCGLGNPGSEYAATKHNVGWWLLDELQKEWGFERFRRVGNAQATEGRLGDQPVRLIKPLTYVNRSGAVLAPYRNDLEFDVASQLLVVVDDVALQPGRMRIRAQGSAGGHNGLKSIEAVLQTQDYARLRIGVGAAPPGEDLADWVLSTFEPEAEDAIRALIPKLLDVVKTWVFEGVEAASRAL
ncbi:MAG TPA: aminoacyl-tRNA hydrolase [Longimicrobiales bacterium]